MRHYPTDVTDDRYVGNDQEDPDGARVSGRSSDTKSIGLAARQQVELAAVQRVRSKVSNLYVQTAGTWLRLQQIRRGTFRRSTSGSRSPYHDQDYPVRRSWPKKHKQEHDQEHYVDKDLEQNNDSPVCELCHGNGHVVQCEHCDFSSEGDLICFRCQSDENSSNGQSCPRCETNERIISNRLTVRTQRGASSGDEGKYPVDAVVKIQVNDHMIDVDSDETAESDLSSNHHHQRSTLDRLDTIVEAKGDTASENDEENEGTKINGTNSARYLNYMIVLFL
ncbi:uncharacterized protein LOC143349058 [Colletes latitarsis]|uniref:uncharacterized protein LOC143349058 n=1 Tax=Colletes latitarsis TaxID=2605962 RepID=UPI0040375980